MSEWQKITLSIIFVAMFGFLMVVLFADKGLLEVRQKQYEHQDLVQGNAQLTKENLQMYRSVDRLKNDLNVIESIARRDHGMVSSDEIVFTFKTGVDKP